MIKKAYLQVPVVVSLIVALFMFPASAKAEDESTREAKSGFFIRPSSGLDIKPAIDEREQASILSPNHLRLSDNIDIGPVFAPPQQQGIPNKKRSTDHRALLGLTFHF